MASLPESIDPLPREGAFCADQHPTAKSVKCEKRAGHRDQHVAWHRGLRVVWGEGQEIWADEAPAAPVAPPAPAGFSRSGGFPATPVRDPARTARLSDLNPLAVTSEISTGYSGEICGDCGAARMVRTGKCLTCTACGSSSGGCS